jgi:chromosome segregation ATPase
MTSSPSSEVPAVQPLNEIDTEPGTDGNDVPLDENGKLDRILEILKKHGEELRDIKSRMRQLEANVQLIYNETQSHGKRLSELGDRCAKRCDALQQIVAPSSVMDDEG